MYPRSRHLLSFLLLAALGACAAPTEEDAVDPAGATSAATAKSSVQHTFVMHEGIAPAFDFKTTMGRLRLSLSASDPVGNEVAKQSELGGAPIEVGALTLLKVVDERTGSAVTVHKEMIVVRAKGNQLEIVSPAPDAFDHYMLVGGTYTLSAMKLPWGEALAFSELDLSVTASW